MRNTSHQIGIAYWVGYLVFMCFFFYFDSIDEYRNSEKTEGVVVDRLMMKGYRRGWHYYPQYSFRYNDSIYTSADAHLPLSGRYQVGKKVTVMFPKGQPDQSVIYSFLRHWISITKLFFSFMIALFLFVSVIFLDWYAQFERDRKKRV